jgi:uncharacterized membrane protein
VPLAAESLDERLRSLAQRVSHLESEVVRLGGTAAPVAEPVVRVEPVIAVAAAPVFEERPIAPEPVPDPADAVPVATAEAAPAFERAAPPAEPNPVWKWLTGGNTLVRVGVLILFIGVAFLVRYAGEHIDVPIEARLAGVAIGAIILLVLGWRLRERAGGYGLVLQGGGVGVLYLVVFGALKIWKLLPAELAFVLLVVIALASAVLAVAQDSRSLAVAGVTGGFLAPILASTGGGSHVMLFSFYLVLDIGVLVVAGRGVAALNLLRSRSLRHRRSGGAEGYRPEHFATATTAGLAFFLLYVAIAVLYAPRTGPEGPRRQHLYSAPLLVAAGLQLGEEHRIRATWGARDRRLHACSSGGASARRCSFSSNASSRSASRLRRWRFRLRSTAAGLRRAGRSREPRRSGSERDRTGACRAGSG